MKKYFAMFLLLVIALLTFGQTTDSTAVVTYNFGDSLLEFLKANMYTLAFVILYLISEWMGESDKIPEGSIWRKVVNFLLSIVKKRATESPKLKSIKAKHEEEIKEVEILTARRIHSEKQDAVKEPVKKEKKGKIAKMIMLAVLLSSFTIGASAQTFSRLIKPVTVETIHDIKVYKLLQSGSDTLYVNDKGALIARFGATVLGAKTNYVDGAFTTQPFTRSGFGITLSNFIASEGKPYNNFGFGGYLLFPVSDNPVEQYMSVMLDVSALQLFKSFTFNVGVGYDINGKKYDDAEVPNVIKRKPIENFFVSPGVKITF